MTNREIPSKHAVQTVMAFVGFIDAVERKQPRKVAAARAELQELGVSVRLRRNRPAKREPATAQ